jgi:predicted aldo/keto reductase-like oxidoreductase
MSHPGYSASERFVFILRLYPLFFLTTLLISGCMTSSKQKSTTIRPSGDSDRKQTEPVEKGIRQYNTLGDTGLTVSDIGFGCGSLTDPAAVQYALDRGINYFDTAEVYAGGRSESAIGQVAAKHRSEMIICTKLVMNGNTKKDEVIERLDGCLERLQTDYCDILMIHEGNRDAVNNPEIFAAFDQLKADGKIRFTGISHHGPDLPGELRPIIETRKVDVILCAYDPVQYPELPEVLQEAHEKGIGLVGMKVLSSARKVDLEEFTSGRYQFHHAALRWGLKTSTMHCLIPSINFIEQVDEYIFVSGAGNE